MTPVTDEISTSITKLQIIAPKIVGPLVASLVAGLISYRATTNMIDATIAGLSALLTFLGYSLSALGTTAKLNPANVANPSAAPAAPPGVANVTSEPVADAEPPATAELRG